MKRGRTRHDNTSAALEAPTEVVIWMVMREVCVLAALGLAISVPPRSARRG